LPGWSRQELEASLELVRTLMMPHWDIHPEMVSHTWAIDTRTGRPYPDRTAAFMENWGFSVGKSADQLGDYLSYALRILKNAGLACEGITTPGGFKIFQEVVRRLNEAYDHLTWMKLSQIARYWTARELTRIERPAPGQFTLHAPFGCPAFTLRITLAGPIASRPITRVRTSAHGKDVPLAPAGSLRQLEPGTFHSKDRTLTVCFDLAHGLSRLTIE
jgi:hypothetical protein